MTERFQFYCVYCERIVQGDHESSIFKTCFYRYNTSMGYCKECELYVDSNIVEKMF